MNFDTFVDAVKSGIPELAKNTVKDFAADAEQDFQTFLESSKDDLRRWTDALADGKLTGDEFGFLVKMRLDLAKMHALTATGIAQARVDRFRKGVTSLVVKSALAVL